MTGHLLCACIACACACACYGALLNVIIINYISSVISGKYCNFTGLQECDLSINRTPCEL